VKEPIFKPDQWITFEQGTVGGFGQIVGAAFDGTHWFYSVSGSLDDGSLRMVREDHIVHLFQNGSWLAPTSFGGQSSAYTTS
jgi:hypothetical protein